MPTGRGMVLGRVHTGGAGWGECSRRGLLVASASRSPCVCARRWPRTLAGITAYQPCLQYPFAAGPAGGGSAAEKQAWRRCDRAGRWEEGDYSHCLYTNDITRVLYTFVLVSRGAGGGLAVPGGPGAAGDHPPRGRAAPQMPINASNALTLAHQLRVYTAEAANFSDMVDVLYVAQMIEKFIGYVDQIKQVRSASPVPCLSQPCQLFLGWKSMNWGVCRLGMAVALCRAACCPRS